MSSPEGVSLARDSVTLDRALNGVASKQPGGPPKGAGGFLVSNVILRRRVRPVRTSGSNQLVRFSCPHGRFELSVRSLAGSRGCRFVLLLPRFTGSPAAEAE